MHRHRPALGHQRPRRRGRPRAGTRSTPRRPPAARGRAARRGSGRGRRRHRPAGRVVRAHHDDDLRPRGDPLEQRVEVVGAVGPQRRVAPGRPLDLDAPIRQERNDGQAMTSSSPGSSRARHMQPDEAVDAGAGQHLRRPRGPCARRSRRAGPRRRGPGTPARPPPPRGIASTAPGIGGNGPSFDASLITDSMPELAAHVVDRPPGLVRRRRRRGRAGRGPRAALGWRSPAAIVEDRPARVGPPPTRGDEPSDDHRAQQERHPVPSRRRGARRRGLLLPRPDRLAERGPGRDGRPGRVSTTGATSTDTAG